MSVPTPKADLPKAEWMECPQFPLVEGGKGTLFGVFPNVTTRWRCKPGLWGRGMRPGWSWWGDALREFWP